METFKKVLESSDPEYQETFREHVILSGGGSAMPGLAEWLQTELSKDVGDVNVTRISDNLYGVARGALKLSQMLPRDHYE